VLKLNSVHKDDQGATSSPPTLQRPSTNITAFSSPEAMAMDMDGPWKWKNGRRPLAPTYVLRCNKRGWHHTTVRDAFVSQGNAEDAVDIPP